MKQCPLNDDYKFRTACRVTTCKMYSTTTACKCMGLDTTFASYDKNVSDAELVVLKFPDMSQREVASLRKRAVGRVHAVLAMSQVVQHIIANERPENGLNSAFMRKLEGDVRRLLRKGFRAKTFRIDSLQLEAWMMPFVLDMEYSSKIVPNFEKFAIHLLFRWTPKELETVSASLTNARRQNHESSKNAKSSR